jgi:D-sedoheptulose 7-phosphate isomerase
LLDVTLASSKAALQYVLDTAEESRAIREFFVHECAPALVEAAHVIGQAIQNGGKVLILGNGGSAADAQHMAAEMVGRMLLERPPLPAIALTTDSSNLTALGNDYGYDAIFTKQVQALAKAGDVVVALSTSGNSKNVLAAVRVARDLGCKIISLTGGSGGELHRISDIQIHAATGKNSSRIQESHIFAVHSIVDLLDRFFLPQHLAPKEAQYTL